LEHAWEAAGNDRHARGCIRMMQGRYDEALEWFEKSHGDERSLFNKGLILAWKGYKKDGFAILRGLREKIGGGKPVFVMIAIPHSGSTLSVFEESLMAMLATIKPEDGIFYVVYRCEGSRITSNRHILVNKAREFNCTHILFIDSDMDFPEDTLHRLLWHKVHIVGGSTCRRGDEEGKVIGEATKESGGIVKLGGKLVEMNSIGTCCLLVNMDVFDAIGKVPFYEPVWEGIDEPIGEDINFCKLAREAGYKLYMDFDLSFMLGHWGLKRYQIKTKDENGDEVKYLKN
jgi:hypothetical protein